MAVGTPGIGYGAEVAYGDGAVPENFTKLGYLGDINGPGTEQDSVETTSQDSASRRKTFIPGLVDEGEVQLDLVLVEGNASQAQVRADIAAGTVRNWRVKKPGGHGYICQAFPTRFEEAVPIGDKMGISVTLKFSGPVTLVTP